MYRGLLRQDGEDCSKMVWCCTTRPQGALRGDGVPRRYCCGVADGACGYGVAHKLRRYACSLRWVQASTSKYKQAAILDRDGVLGSNTALPAHFRGPEQLQEH